MLEVQNKKNYKSVISGIDSLEYCKDREFFLSYPDKIFYEYNSKGFRDKEWPESLDEVIWCVGDSFTVGIGLPFEHTWPAMLEKATKLRCINLSSDGCSNDRISMRVDHIRKNHKPKLLIVMWSYPCRRIVDGKDVAFSDQDWGIAKDFANFKHNYSLVNHQDNVINFMIPDAVLEKEKTEWDLYKKDSGIHYYQVDLVGHARDKHHFGKKTSHNIVDIITNDAKIKKLKDR